MGVAMSFILGLFLRIFQFISFFSSFFYFFNQKTSVALTGYDFACLFFVSPRTITSGLLGTQFPNLIKNYSQFSFFGDSHD
jgi:hypothetical protein